MIQANTTSEYLEQVKALAPEARAALEAMFKAQGQPIWVPQPGPQTAAYESLADIVFYGGAAGGGKGQPLDAPVLTPFGFRPMGSLKVGSLVSTPDGSASQVIGVYPLGERQLYRFTFHDGTSTEVTDDHIWLAWKASGHGERRLWTTAQLVKAHARGGRFCFPVTEPVQFTDQARAPRRPVDPYLLGVLLGDGSITDKALRITTADPEIIERIARLTGVAMLGPYKYAGRTAEYRLPEPNDARQHLEKWGLVGANSFTKFIPPAYLLGSVAERWELLRGLMDTDGWADADGDTYYCTVSTRLRDDVAALARSLGALVTIRSKMARSQNGNGSLAYTLRIKLPKPALAFSLPRKLAACADKVPQSMARRLVSIEQTRIAPAQCIKVANPNGLYLTDGYIVTHNTDLLLGLCLTSQKHSIVFRRQAVQLTGIEERMTNILGTRDGYNSQVGIWRLPGGRVMELGSVKEPEDWIKYQGRPHDAKCVGRGTLVKMANGGYKAIELVEIGDYVATLEGARKVTRTFVLKKPAALAKAVLNGEVIAQQVQSRTHRLLSPSGWAALCTTPDRAASSPTQRHCACKCGESSSQTFERSFAVPQERYSDRVQPPAPSQGHAGCQSQSGSCADAGTSNPGSGFAAFAYRLSRAALRFSGSVLQELAQPFHAKSVQGSALPSPAHGENGVPSASSLGDSQGNCLSDPRHGGGQPPRAQAGGLACLLLSDDVAQQTPKHFAGDGLGKTPTHTRRVEWYFHPYTWEKRQIQAEFLEASLEFQEVGEQELFDITVDGANHYITAGGLVNRNCFDEITHFTESQFRTLIGWLRTDDPTIRQRVVCAGNPPTDPEGEWVKRFWAPWLDPNHPNPAKPGELRWFVTNEKGEDEEVAGPELVKVGTDMVKPKSRTFIPSSVDDNLFLLSTGYKATLQSLPEPLRSQMLRGDFNAGASDPAWQVIPTEWVKAAQARWKPRDEKGPMTAAGFDPARGGMDKSCLARRHDNWFDQLISAPGAVTKDGPTAAAFVVPQVRDGACICVDSIGIGSSALDFLVGLGLNVYAVNGAETSTAVTKAGNLRMRNRRAEAYWLLREALDPTNPEPIALPPDQELLGDLTAVRYKVVTMGKLAAIQMRSKDEVREALGRSPDKGDAVAMTFVQGIPTPLSRRDDYEEPKEPDWRL